MFIHIPLFIVFFIFAYSALYIGSWISRFAFDEVNALHPWYNLLQASLVVLSIFVLIIFYPLSIWLSLGLGGLIIIFLLSNKNKHYLVEYLILGVFFAFSSFNQEAFVYIFLLTFLYGLVVSFHTAKDLFSKGKEKEDRELRPKQYKELIKNTHKNLLKSASVVFVTYIVCFLIIYFTKIFSYSFFM
jgi:hypothetical protein